MLFHLLISHRKAPVAAPGFETKPCRCYGQVRDPPAPQQVDISKQAETFVKYIAGHQADDGWLGPPQNSGTDYWARSNAVLSLIQFAEGAPTTAETDNATQAVLRFLLCEQARVIKTPLTSWAAQRGQDLALGVAWMLRQPAPVVAAEERARLWDLADALRAQTVDWESWFNTFDNDAGPHNVNNAQGLKSAAVWYSLTGNETLRRLSRSRMTNMDDRYGLPTGMFNGDELLPSPPTRSPSRGIELCGVVEAMFSYSTMFSTFGDVAYADRAERIAFNALPATWASPKGGDMWSHQ
jgi:hypothetical protein